MKKKTIAIGMLGIFCISFVLLCSNVVGWRNMHNANPTNPNKMVWTSYDYDLDYSTHDWIAEVAMKSFKWRFDWLGEDNDENPFWTTSRQMLFLWATAVPDRSSVVDRSFLSNNMNEVHIIPPSTKISHHIYFNKNLDGIIDRETTNDAYTGAEDCANGAVEALQAGDCDLAAFYLGSMAHYIVDISNIRHVHPSQLDNGQDWMTDVQHSKLETLVSSRTDCSIGSNPYSSIEGKNAYFYPLNDECFDLDYLDSDWYNQYNDDVFTPAFCAKYLAWNTRYDSNYATKNGIITRDSPGTYDATWMKDTFIDDLYLDPYWPQHDDASSPPDHYRSEWQSWTGDEKHFLDRLEESFQIAFEMVAHSIYWVFKTVDDLGGYLCGGGNEPFYMRQIANQYMGLYSLMAIAGGIASLMTVAISRANKTKRIL